MCLSKKDLARISPVLLFIIIMLVLHSVFSLWINGTPSEDNEKVHSDINDKVISPLTKSTYSFIKDILIYSYLFCIF